MKVQELLQQQLERHTLRLEEAKLAQAEALAAIEAVGEIARLLAEQVEQERAKALFTEAPRKSEPAPDEPVGMCR